MKKKKGLFSDFRSVIEIFIDISWRFGGTTASLTFPSGAVLVTLHDGVLVDEGPQNGGSSLAFIVSSRLFV